MNRQEYCRSQENLSNFAGDGKSESRTGDVGLFWQVVTFSIAHRCDFVIIPTEQTLTNLSQISVDLTEIRKIVELMDEHGLSQFQFEKEDFNLKLKKGTDFEEIQKLMSSMPVAAAPAAAAPAPAPAAAAPSEAASSDGGNSGEAAGDEISSPMVGTFYRKPSPDDPDFVNVGDSISEGQTLCIIEAMKVMNEIKAERSGTITQICVDDGTAVQFGDALFRVQ